jgi:hypothetical protein
MMYLELDDRRLSYWERWTRLQAEGAVVRHASRDAAREKAALLARREQIAAQMGAETPGWQR